MKNIKVYKKISLIFILLSIFLVEIYKNYYIKSIIPIAFATDYKYVYPLIVLLTSILYNAKSTTLYYFYIMIPYNIKYKTKIKFLKLKNKFSKFKLKFINFGKKFINWKKGHYSQTVYYRLCLSDLIKDFNKIIYLDVDTMVHKDLSELYNIEMENNYFMGFPGLEIRHLQIKGTRNFINSGVMLINLKSLRKLKASLLFENYYNKYGTKKVDEYLINIIFYNHIKFLPLKYGIPCFNKRISIISSPSKFWESFNGYSNSTKSEMISSSIDPVITHGAYFAKKWWNWNYEDLSIIGKKWIFYASKSHVFNEICKHYSQYKKICEKIK